MPQAGIYATSPFKGSVVLNPRDAMVFGEVVNLSWQESEEVIRNELAAFRDMLRKDYGGKGVVIISPELFDKASEEHRERARVIINAVFQPEPDKGMLRLITADVAKTAWEVNSKKEYVKKHLSKFETNELRILSQDELIQRRAELSKFKILSGHVNDAKVNAGQYNEIAEQDKLRNPFNRHLVVVDKYDKLIACVMWTSMASKMVYAADFSIDPAYQSTAEYRSGFSRAIAVKVYEAIIKEKPEFRGITFIGGVVGNLPHVQSFYGKEGLNCLTLDLKAQSEYGIYLHYTGPGPVLMKHMNRDPAKTQPGEISSKDLSKYIEDARELIKRAKDGGKLAAAQPLPQIPKQEVMGISSFAQKQPETPVIQQTPQFKL